MTDTSTADLVLHARAGAVLRLTLNRPEKRNALNTPLRTALVTALESAANDPAVRVVVLTGAGEAAFVAGADVADFEGRTAVDQYRFMRTKNVFEAVDRFPKPVIAAVNGYCFGGGLEIALACDIRLAASTARFGQPEINLGIMPGGGATQRLPRIIGPGAAARLVLTGLPIDATEAYRLRLVDEIVAPEQLLDRAHELAERIATRSPVATQAAKAALRAAADMPLTDGLAHEIALFQLCFSSEDKAEGVRAFLDKREANFRGR